MARKRRRRSSGIRFNGFTEQAPQRQVNEHAPTAESPATADLPDASRRPRHVHGLPTLPPQSEDERRRRQELQAVYSEREAERKRARISDLDRPATDSTRVSHDKPFSPWAWEQARHGDAETWAATVELRTHDALMSAAPLVLRPLEYAAAVRTVSARLAAGQDPIDDGGRWSLIEYFCLRRDFEREGFDAYSGSNHWRRRSALQRIARNVCERCRLERDNEHGVLLDAHHLHYATVGAERVEVDLITLCRWCHDLEHQRGRLTPVLGLLVPHELLYLAVSDQDIPF